MKKLKDTLYMTWVIGSKDIVDTLKNKSSLVNLLVMLIMVFFFYWLNFIRPFDKRVSVVVYDEGDTSLTVESVTLDNGAEYTFLEASSLQEMEEMMAHKKLGLVLPADLDQTLASGEIPTLQGSIFWHERSKVDQLEGKYSSELGQILGQPAQVQIGQNIIIPHADADGDQTNLTFLMIYFVFSVALLLIPFLMLEEKKTGTMDALMTSPASPGQVVLGKAMAGFFYILLIGGLALALFSPFVVHWGLTLLAFLCYAFMAVGLGLVVGSFIKATRQMGLWFGALMIILVIPPLFYSASNLKEGLRGVLTWFPTSALAKLMRYAFSTGVTASHLLPNIAIVILSIVLIYGLVIWKVRRSDQ